MVPSGFPTGTVSSGRDDPSTGRRNRDRSDGDPRARIAELERENEALRAAVERQRRENERIVERYERLLDRERSETETDADEADAHAQTNDAEGVIDRVSRLLADRD